MIKKSWIIIFIVTISFTVHGQYSQYMVNGLVINPAYAGSRDGLSLSAHYAKVWTGIAGMPEQEILSAHFPLKNDKLAFGMIIGNRTAGSTHSMFGSLDYTFRIHLKKSILGLGLRAGIDYKDENFNQLYFDPNMPQDPVFINNTLTEPNAGFGIYYYSKRFFTGFSIPRMITYKFSDTTSYSYGPTLQPQYAHYMFSAGALIGEIDGFKWRPSFLAQYLGTVSDYRLDINSMFIFLKDRVWLGASYRMGGNTVASQVVGIIELKMNDQFMLGYSYDYTMGQFSSVLNATHEVYLRYDFVYKIRAANPRYF
ncbi:MAG: type IX secretion system membrane protein PorP/SprF [Chlorobi bacterium]|nr:type IX secretion system membrane protein PorP/SprF [Chlorobiota bacterium]